MTDLLIKLGAVLFFLGLVSGALIPAVKNARMGVTSHLEGTQNGMMLIFLGIIWSRVDLARGWGVAAVALCIYSAYMNWFATQLSAILGAGRSIAPVASRDHEGTRGQELLIRSLLTSVGVALFLGFPIIMVGLFRA